MGISSVCDVDNLGHIRAAYPDGDCVPGMHLLCHVVQPAHEDAPRGLHQCQHCGWDLQGSHKDCQDDRCDRPCLCGLLGAFLHRAAVVSVGRRRSD